MSTLSNRKRLELLSAECDAILTDIKEKNAMIDAGETHGAEWAKRENDLAECETLLTEMQIIINQLDYLL